MNRTLHIITTIAILLLPMGNAKAEQHMQADLLQMLADFSAYMKADFQQCQEPNSAGEDCGCFRGENTMGSDERGVRTNADLSMVCAFLLKYAQGQATLPQGVSWDDVRRMARQSLTFAYSTHKANRLKTCRGGRYWGSVSAQDHVWESSLWAMSVAYSAFFQWDTLSDEQKACIYRLLKAECDYELQRTIPTAYAGDTKAEENGWEADVLAATLGLFPDDRLAPQWFQRLREFAVNSYSHPADAHDTTVVDPHYDRTTVGQLYSGQNLYDDYTLQNHNYFHTSYQNVVIQELGEAALALKLFQGGLHGKERWRTNALMHNCDRVMRDVLYWLALSDGELAMPNGNDWSLFLYDQLTSYTTNACFLRDPHALMLERLAYRMIKARQQTTPDGAWLLRPDVGARRMGVEAHRVMMTWLMHHVLSTADMTATSWEDFCREYGAAKVFTSQNIVRASTDQRFTCFAWSQGLSSYTGYIAPHLPSSLPSSPSPSSPSPSSPSPSSLPSPSFCAAAVPQLHNLIVPFRAHNTGNLLGWYEVEGCRTNATPAVSGIYDLHGNAYTMNGELLTNDSALNHRFAIYSTPGNAVIYIDKVRANRPCTITKERGALMAVSVDPFTSTTRTLYSAQGRQQLDGTTTVTITTPWVNIDNRFGIVNAAADSRHTPQMAFGERANNNSVLTARLYAAFSDDRRNADGGETVDRRAIVYYSNTDSETTAALAGAACRPDVPDGWNAIIAPDDDDFGPDAATYFMLLSNFDDADRQQQCTLSRVMLPAGCPVFQVPTFITAEGSTATFKAEPNHSVTATLHYFVDGCNVKAIEDGTEPGTVVLTNLSKRKNKVTVHCVAGDSAVHKTITLAKEKTRRISFR